MFYINCGEDLHLVGASPECLCKVEERVVTNHALAGTVRRGKTAAGESRSIFLEFSLSSADDVFPEDVILAETLLASVKDRAEHVMLVDLARNDVNRVCKPETVQVDSLMQIEKFSHVMHITSQVSGVLREGLTRSVSTPSLPLAENHFVWSTHSFFQLQI